MDIFALLSGLGDSMSMVLAFVVALSVIVSIHEYGHYIVGRWSGIHAEVFSLGFGPVIWSRVDSSGTQWQLAAFPLGGFVRFKGDSNAASGKDNNALDSMPDVDLRSSMHGAPLWARTATVAAGPIFNFIFSILIFTAVIMSRGQVGDKLIVAELRDLPNTEYTLREGDHVRSIDGRVVPVLDDAAAYNAFWEKVTRANPLTYQVERDGEAIEVTGPYLYPPIILHLVPRSAAITAGLRVGDFLVEIDGRPIVAFSELKSAVENGQGRTLRITVNRDGSNQDFELTPRRVDEPDEGGGFKTYWRIGIGGGLAFEPAKIAIKPGNALLIGVEQTGRIITGSISGLYHMVTGAISSCNLSGPVGIAQTSGAMASQGLTNFIWFIAVLSTAIGMLNLFPIPVLDGGHLVFFAYEAIVGRPPSDAVLRILMVAGLVIVLGLMLFGLTNDFLCP
ncbi:RIP metalloprotease RseP [Pseudopelagicola sp. nBUS_19]|uniref:RIP metalloprotease RseP n=1 Tax=Pseudopelagicola sp. nBUS_19 TaxID=3395316 RepID=UPI003EB6C7D0